MLQQQHDWIPLDFRPLFIPHRVSRIPHLRVRQPLRAVICSGYCSVISRFRFSLPFFLPFLSPPPPSLSLLHFIIKSARITIGSNSTCRMEIHWEIGILIWSRTIVESKAFVRRMVFPLVRIDGISLVDDRCHDRPYFRIYHYLFFSPPKDRYFSSAFRFTTKIFYDLSNRLETTFCSSYRILNIFDKDSISCFWNVIL